MCKQRGKRKGEREGERKGVLAKVGGEKGSTVKERKREIVSGVNERKGKCVRGRRGSSGGRRG